MKFLGYYFVVSLFAFELFMSATVWIVYIRSLDGTFHRGLALVISI